jgi:glucosyl-3-phosphoglycerate synthase
VIRRFDHSDYPLELLRERKDRSASVVLPAREVADTIEPMVETLAGLDLFDQVLVVDAASEDGTAELARRAGAEVHQESELMPERGPVRGKGDAMRRGLSATAAELVVFMDSDTRDFAAHFGCGLLGPLLVEERVDFLKGSFRRPTDGPSGGGRVTELTARPLLKAFYPELAGFTQPLAGEVAAPRAVFERLPFAEGYAVETAMLLAAWDELGSDRMAQVDLGERRNYHQPLERLGPMAESVLGVILDRLRAEGRLSPG